MSIHTSKDCTNTPDVKQTQLLTNTIYLMEVQFDQIEHLVECEDAQEDMKNSNVIIAAIDEDQDIVSLHASYEEAVSFLQQQGYERPYLLQ